MDITKEIYSKIEAYLRNRMSEKERQAFEDEIGAQAELAAEVEIYRELMGGIKDVYLKQELSAIYDDWKSKNKPLRWIPYAIAASITILITIAISIWVLMPPKLSSAQQIAQNWIKNDYHRAPEVGVTLGQNTTATPEKDWQEADGLYGREKYDEALSIYLQKQKYDPENQKLIYRIGISYLGAEKFEKAWEAFEQIEPSSVAPEMYAKALWFKGLALLRLDRTQDSKQILEQLASMDSEKKRKAEKLLKEIHDIH